MNMDFATMDDLVIGLKDFEDGSRRSIKFWSTTNPLEDTVQLMLQIVRNAVACPLNELWPAFLEDNEFQRSGWYALCSYVAPNSHGADPLLPDPSTVFGKRVLVLSIDFTTLMATCKVVDQTGIFETDIPSANNSSLDSIGEDGTELRNLKTKDNTLEEFATRNSSIPEASQQGSSRNGSKRLEDAENSDEDEDEELRIALMHLFPLGEQPGLMNLDPTVRCLSVLRAYSFLRLPWDSDDSDKYVENALPRLALQDQRHQLPQRHQRRLFELVADGKDTNRRLAQCRSELEAMRSCVDVEREEGLRLQDIKLQFDLRQLEFEYKNYQNPLFRELLMSRLSDVCAEEDLIEERVIVVLKDLTCSGALFSEISNLLRLKNLDSVTFRISDDLQDVLRKCKVGSTIILGPGQHLVENIGNVSKGGTIIGLHDPIIKSIEVGDNWIVISSECPRRDNIRFENLVLEVPKVTVEYGGVKVPAAAYTTAILIESGTLHLNNVIMKGFRPDERDDHPGHNATKTEGIHALYGTSLYAERLEMKGFSTCIALSPRVAGTLKDCTLAICEIGLVNESKEIKLDGLIVHDFKTCDVKNTIKAEPDEEERIDETMSDEATVPN